MSTSQAIFGTWLRTRIAPRLRERGFAGSGQDFHRRVDRNWQAVNIQRSKWSSADEVKFTINLGTASAAVMDAAGVDPDEPPREVVCHWRTRIGSLLPGKRDTWWSVRSTVSERDLDRLDIEVGAALIVHGMPMLDRMVTDARLLELHLPRDDAGLKPFAQDIVGPLLRALGPPDRFAQYMRKLDESHPESEPSSIFDVMPVRMGPARTAKALARLHRSGWEQRQRSLIELAHAAPTPEVLAAVVMALNDPHSYVKMAAAHAAGRLGVVDSVDALLVLVESAPREVASCAALAGTRLAERLDAADRQRLIATIRTRHAAAVGQERPLLGHLLGRLVAA